MFLINSAYAQAPAAAPQGAGMGQFVFLIGLMVLLLLTVVQRELMGDWRDSLPDDIPNRFLINIQDDQIEKLEAFFQQENRQPPVFAPMVKARLVSINGRNVSPDDYDRGEARRLLNREFNLSWAESVQADNEIVAGKWWDKSRDRKSVV